MQGGAPVGGRASAAGPCTGLFSSSSGFSASRGQEGADPAMIKSVECKKPNEGQEEPQLPHLLSQVLGRK
jgi:hypothetical protein